MVIIITLLLINTNNCVRRHLSDTEVARGIQLIEDGLTHREVANRLGVSCSVVTRFVRRYEETGQYTRRPGQGRQRCTTGNQDRYLRITARRDRQVTARRMQIDFMRTENQPISVQTIRNRLHEAGLNARRPVIAPVLTIQHRRARLEYARDHLNWRLPQWSNVLFTDESRFMISTCDRRVRVWRRTGERYHEANVIEHNRFGGGGIMVWGGICIQGRTDLVVFARGSVTAQRYRDEVLHPHVRPFAGAMGQDFILMQDNARAHTARLCRDYLEEQGIEVMDWPASSPDLNPIEHLWDLLGRRIRQRINAPGTVQELTQALVEEWNAIPQENIRRLIQSMHNRCDACITARGGHTRY